MASLLKESIDNGRYFKGTIQSESMSPLLNINDQILIGHCPPEKLKLGDLIVFNTSKHLCCHRFMYSRSHQHERIIVSKGDSEPCFDTEAVLLEHIIGKVLLIEKPQVKIKTTSKFWKILNYLIGAISFTQGAIVGTMINLRRDHKKNQFLYKMQRAFSILFSKVISRIISLSLLKVS